MVRNAASMQNLRQSMSEVNLSSPAPAQPGASPSRLQTLGESPQATARQSASLPQHPYVNLLQPTQMVGDDAYTKSLMTRVATGVATPQELAMWQQHVARLKAIKPTGSRQDVSMGQQPQHMQSQITGQPKPAMSPATEYWAHSYSTPQAQTTLRPEAQAPSISNPVPDDYLMQLMLLEQQNKQRALYIRQEQDREKTNAAAAYPERRAQQQPMGTTPAQQSPVLTAEEAHVEWVLAEQAKMRKAQMEEQQKASNQAAAAENERQQKQRQAETQARMMQQLARQQAALQTMNTTAPSVKQATRQDAAKYTEPFCRFLTDNPTVFHAVDAIGKQLKDAGFTKLSERDSWDLKAGGSYFVERNGSSMIAFTVGSNYKPGNGAAILAGHVDALTAKLKPISQVPNKAGYVQLGVAPYAGAPNTTWWDRDLSIGGRVLVKEGHKIVSKLVKLDWPIARIPTLAPHFGMAAVGPFNPETQMVPIIGLDSPENATNSDLQTGDGFSNPSLLANTNNGGAGCFANTQPPRLVKAIGNALGLRGDTYAQMVDWELELFDTQPATVGGLDKEFIFAGRIDDKLCSWAAIQALIESSQSADEASKEDSSSIIKMVGLFDDEEIGSGLRQGARGNLLPIALERIVGSMADHNPTSDLMGRTYANSFLVSSDVTHAVNPNFLGAYLENHAPHLNVGLVVSADSNGHMTTDALSTAVLKRCAEKVGAKLQVFQIRNDSRSGGTVGPMLSSMTGMRAIDAGIPQLSMHSIRATTGSLDPGLGVIAFLGFLNSFEAVDKEFKD